MTNHSQDENEGERGPLAICSSGMSAAMTVAATSTRRSAVMSGGLTCLAIATQLRRVSAKHRCAPVIGRPRDPPWPVRSVMAGACYPITMRRGLKTLTRWSAFFGSPADSTPLIF